MDISLESLLQGALISISLVLLYIYLTKNFDYWKKQGVKTLYPIPILGSIRPLFKQTLFEKDFENHSKFGPVYGFFEFSNPVLKIADPEIIKEIFVKDFSVFSARRLVPFFERYPSISRALVYLQGEEWRIVRTATSPGFSSGKLKQMIPTIENVLKVFIQSLDKYANKRPVEMKRLLAAFTLDMTAACAFGMRTHTIENPNNEFSKKTKSLIHDPSVIALIPFLFPKLTSIFGWISDITFKKHVEFFTSTITRIIERKYAIKSVEKAVDFLDCLLEAKAKAESSGNEKIKKNLDGNTIISQCTSFLVVGLESISTSISMIAYSLAKNEQIQEKLIQEIDELLVKNNGNINYEDVANLSYLDMVFNEGVRQYPPVYRSERTCGAEEMTLKNGITLKKGMTVIASIYALHYNPKYFPNPHNFDPERFNPGNKEKINMDAFMPFGVGPRQCPAIRFATIAAKLTIFYLFSKYRIKTCSKTETPVKFFNNLSGFLTPISITLLIETRNDQPK